MYKLSEIQAIIREEFDNLTLEKPPVSLYQPVEYLLSNGGKRLRPSLVLMAYNLYHQDIEKAINAALALEIFHNFTLMHDDIMDNANMRRGKTTVHKKWNENTAILSGDAMAIISYHYLTKYNSTILSPVLETFNDTAIKVCEGQQYDMDFESRNDVSEEEYLKMIELKTSVLIAACLKIGALIAKAPEKDAHHLYEFGKNIGIAFQLKDDFLDSFGDEKVFGKKIGGDILADKKTFLLINAMRLADEKDTVSMQSLIGKQSIDPDEKIEKILEIYKKYHIDGLTNKKIDQYYNLSLENLNKIDLDDGKKEELKSFAINLMQREH